VEDRALIQQQLRLSHRLLKHSLNDITDEEAHRIPAQAVSPIVWQAGHVAYVNFSFAYGPGQARDRSPETYPGLFATGTGGPAGYPPLASVVKAVDDSHAALVARVAEANLSTPADGPFGAWSNFAEMFAFANSHCWYHIGKIATLRALLGKPRLLG
jgi:DinB superfamily